MVELSRNVPQNSDPNIYFIKIHIILFFFSFWPSWGHESMILKKIKNTRAHMLSSLMAQLGPLMALAGSMHESAL